MIRFIVNRRGKRWVGVVYPDRLGWAAEGGRGEFQADMEVGEDSCRIGAQEHPIPAHLRDADPRQLARKLAELYVWGPSHASRSPARAAAWAAMPRLWQIAAAIVDPILLVIHATLDREGSGAFLRVYLPDAENRAPDGDLAARMRRALRQVGLTPRWLKVQDGRPPMIIGGVKEDPAAVQRALRRASLPFHVEGKEARWYVWWPKGQRGRHPEYAFCLEVEGREIRDRPV